MALNGCSEFCSLMMSMLTIFDNQRRRSYANNVGQLSFLLTTRLLDSNHSYVLNIGSYIILKSLKLVFVMNNFETAIVDDKKNDLLRMMLESYSSN